MLAGDNAEAKKHRLDPYTPPSPLALIPEEKMVKIRHMFNMMQAELDVMMHERGSMATGSGNVCPSEEVATQNPPKEQVVIEL